MEEQLTGEALAESDVSKQKGSKETPKNSKEKRFKRLEVLG